MYIDLRHSACKFGLDISHENGEEDNKQIGGKRAALPDAGALGVSGRARVDFVDFKSGVVVNIFD